MSTQQEWIEAVERKGGYKLSVRERTVIFVFLTDYLDDTHCTVNDEDVDGLIRILHRSE